MNLRTVVFIDTVMVLGLEEKGLTGEDKAKVNFNSKMEIAMKEIFTMG